MAASTGRPEDRFPSPFYWLFAIAGAIYAATVVGYMLKTVGHNVQDSRSIQMPMTDNSGQILGTK